MGHLRLATIISVQAIPCFISSFQRKTNNDYFYATHDEYEDYNSYLYDDSYEDYDTYGNGLEEDKPQRKATNIVGPVVQLTQRYVAPYEDPIDNNIDFDEEERSGNSKKKVQVSLLDFDIYPTLRPPPISSETTRSTTSLPVFKDPREKHFHRDASDQDQENSSGINTLKHGQHNSFEHGQGNSLNSGDQPNSSHNDQENPNLSPASTDGCPGNNLRTCVEACVPLPQLWIYVVCVKECVRRCP